VRVMTVGAMMTDGLGDAVLHEQTLVMMDTAQGQMSRVVILVDREGS